MTPTQRNPAAQRRRRLIWRSAASLSLSAVFVAAGLVVAAPAAATGNTLRVDPATSTVPQGGTFTVHVVQNADVPASGFGATLTFDPTLLQITAVARGAAYTAAPVFNGASANAIAAANATGSLTGVGSSFFPPDSVPAGDADAVDVTFHAVGCGTAQLGLPTGVNNAAILDGRDGTYGDALALTTIGGSVTTCVAVTPTPSTSPSSISSGSPSLSPTQSPSLSPSPSPSPSPTPPPGNTIRLIPATTTVDKDAAFSVRVVQHGEFAIGGVTATVAFDPTIVQITGITVSPAYATTPSNPTATVPALGEGAIATTIADANASGRTQIAGSFQVDATTHAGASVPAGDADFITIQFKAVACGATPLLLPADATDNQLIDGRTATYGKAVATGTVGGSVTVCTSQATPAPSVPSGNSLRVVPYSTLVVHNGGFTVKVTQKTTVPSGGTTATILFDPSMLQVVSITKSDAFAASAFFQGADPAAIKAANASGRLNQVAAAFVAPGNVPAGEADFISVEFKSIACGESLLLLPNDPALTTILSGQTATYGQALTIATVKGVVLACDKNAKPTPRPTATPPPTPYPTAAPTQAPTSAVMPPTPVATLAPPPTESAAAQPAVTPAPTPTRKPAMIVRPTRPPSAAATMPPATSVAFVGLGVAGVIAGLVIVLLMTTAMVASLLIPLFAMRAVRARNGRQSGNRAATRD